MKLVGSWSKRDSKQSGSDDKPHVAAGLNQSCLLGFDCSMDTYLFVSIQADLCSTLNI